MKKLQILLCFGLLTCATLGGAELKLENLGDPVRAGEIPIIGLTRPANAPIQAWAAIRLPERRGLLGIDTVSGKTTWCDLGKYNSQLMLGRTFKNKVYALLKRNPALMVEFNPATGKLKEFPLPIKGGYFVTSSGDIAPDGRIYVGTYPETQVAWLDPATGEVGGTPRISPDARQKYILYLLADARGGIYFTVGLHHPELWYFDPSTKAAKQLLPDDMQKTTERVRIFRGTDGKIYARIGNHRLLCSPEGVTATQAWPVVNSTALFPCDRMLDANREATTLTSGGTLLIEDAGSKEPAEIATDFAPFSPLVYSICPGLDGKIWVGSFTPAALASFEHRSEMPKYTNYGKRGSGNVQIYWTLEFPDRVYTSSYVGAALDRMDKKSGESKTVFRLEKKELQERLFMLVPGADGKYYGPTMPVKGHLGGGIVEFDPATDRYHFERNVIPQQSLRALAPLAGGKLLFGVSDINGGTSAIPTEKTAKVFLYSPAERKAVWTAEPIPGEKYYLGAYPLGNDRFWTAALTTRKIVVVNAAKRQVEKVINLPRGSGLRPVGSCAALPGQAIVLGGNALYSVDTDGGKVTRLLTSPLILEKFTKSLHGTHAEYLTPDGTVYFGNHATLYRVRLK